MEPRSPTDSETLKPNEVLQQIDVKTSEIMATLETKFFYQSGWRIELAKEYHQALNNLKSKWQDALSDDPTIILNMNGLYTQILNLQKIIDTIEEKVYKVCRNDFEFLDETIRPLKSYTDILISSPSNVLTKAKIELENASNNSINQSTAAHHYAAALTSLNNIIGHNLPDEAIRIKNICTQALIDILRDKSILAQLGKEKTLALIEALPDENKVILLEESLNKTTTLGELFWKKEGWKNCSLTSGSLKKIQESYDNLSANYLNTACNAFMTNLSGQAFKIPKGETIDSIQKINALNLIKRDIADNQIGPIDKIQLLHAALNPHTDLGRIFWKKRGQTEPNLDSGTLKELQSLLHKQQVILAPSHNTRSSTYSDSMRLFQPSQSTSPTESLSTSPGATNQNENTTPEKTTAYEGKIHGPGHR